MKHFLNSRYEYANEWVDDLIASQFPIMMYFPHKILKILIFLLKHVKVCPYIKLYQSKHYSAFIQSGSKASFTLS